MLTCTQNASIKQFISGIKPRNINTNIRKSKPEVPARCECDLCTAQVDNQHKRVQIKSICEQVLRLLRKVGKTFPLFSFFSAAFMGFHQHLSLVFHMLLLLLLYLRATNTNRSSNAITAGRKSRTKSEKGRGVKTIYREMLRLVAIYEC